MVNMTIGRLWGSGVWVILADLVCDGRIFSQTSLELEIFSPTYNGVRFFFSMVRHERYFFSAGYFSPREFICVLFSSRNQSAGHFFRNHPEPLKSQMVGP